MAVYDSSSPYIQEYYGQNSIRFYYGEYDSRSIPCRIGDTITNESVETERYYDTWETFRLIPSERPTVTVPKPNAKLISIPGKKDPLDFSKYLTGHITFQNRTGSWTFLIDNDFVDKNGGWITFEKYLRGRLHGRIFKVVFKEDPGYFYVGEITMSQWNTGTNWSNISLTYNLYPYKKAFHGSLEHWMFDDFDFNDGIIQYLKNMEIAGQRNVIVYGSKERISPHISGTPDIFIDKFENNTWVSYGNVPTASLDSSESIIPRFIIDNGINRLRFRGNGTVTIDYRRGLL